MAHKTNIKTELRVKQYFPVQYLNHFVELHIMEPDLLKKVSLTKNFKN